MPTNRNPRSERNVQLFIEQFASSMVQAGMPRMPARVFVALLVSDSGRLTAAELAAQLQVSPAAVSGAVRYLAQVNLIVRGREPGSRRDHFEVHGDTWQEAILNRDRTLARWIVDLHAGIAAVGARTPAGRRITETVDFLEFVDAETEALMERWRSHRAAAGAKPAARAAPRRR